MRRGVLFSVVCLSLAVGGCAGKGEEGFVEKAGDTLQRSAGQLLGLIPGVGGAVASQVANAAHQIQLEEEREKARERAMQLAQQDRSPESASQSVGSDEVAEAAQLVQEPTLDTYSRQAYEALQKRYGERFTMSKTEFAQLRAQLKERVRSSDEIELKPTPKNLAALTAKVAKPDDSDDDQSSDSLASAGA